MTKALIEEALLFFEHFATQKGKIIRISEYISTNKDNYNRHFTTFAEMTFELERFGVRFSGARALFHGQSQFYEISADRLIKLEDKGDNIFELTEKYSEKVYRKSILKFTSLEEEVEVIALI